jgi:DeoR family transcriptional regulator, copper-sensing transcriptional repressor
MKTSPEIRRAKLQELLNREGTITVREIKEELGISAMTANRDISALVQSGLARRVRGGLALPENTDKNTCTMCQGPVPLRTRFILPRDNLIEMACCPHCGIVLMIRDNIPGALAVDFLYGSVIPASQAVYVAESEVRMCCTPSIISFLDLEDAKRFSRGFGGIVLDFSGIANYIKGTLDK